MSEHARISIAFRPIRSWVLRCNLPRTSRLRSLHSHRNPNTSTHCEPVGPSDAEPVDPSDVRADTEPVGPADSNAEPDPIPLPNAAYDGSSVRA